MKNDVTILADSMADLEWFREHSRKIREEYEGQVVAIKNKKIVASAQNSMILLNKIKQKKIDDSKVLIEYIPEKNEVLVL